MNKEYAVRAANNITATVPPVYQSNASMMMLVPADEFNRNMTEIKSMLQMLLQKESTSLEKSDLIGINEASTLLQVSVSTIYKLTAKNAIPFIKRPGSKKLLFSRTELDTWNRKPQCSPSDLLDEFLHKRLRVQSVQNN